MLIVDQNWIKLKPIRSMIEDVFKLAKDSYSMAKIHRCTMKSFKKHSCLNVLLIRMSSLVSLASSPLKIR